MKKADGTFLRSFLCLFRRLQPYRTTIHLNKQVSWGKSAATHKQGGFLRFRLNKGELRMRRSRYGPLQCSLAAPAPGTAARSRRWNLVLIAILAFIVLGVFVVAEAPRTGSSASNAANVSLQGSASPASAGHAKSINGIPPENRGKEGPTHLHNDFRSGHHAG